MGLVDSFGKEDRVEVKFTDFYSLMRGCTEREMITNAVINDVPRKYIKKMIMKPVREDKE